MEIMETPPSREQATRATCTHRGILHSLSGRLCRCALHTVLVATLGACAQERPPDGHIVVKNDSQDRSYNVITVSGGGAYASLKPGERLVLPAGIKSFSVQRRYKDYTRSYSVECPPLTGKGVFIKLIDIHVNRIAGGCRTTFASKQ